MQKLRRCGAMLLALAVTFTSLQLGSIKAYASEELPLDEAFTASSGMSTEEVTEEDLEKDTEEIGAENENGGVEASNDAALSDLPENNNDQEKEQNEGNTADPQDENSENENASDPETITITFDANGGLFPDGKTLSVIDAYKGQGLSTLPMNPEQKDSSFVFSGWYLEKNAETVVDLTTFTADEDITLYAGYSETAEVSEEEENTLVGEQGGFTLHANGGLFTKYETLNETYHVNYITRTLSSYIPVREGFVFTGWYKEPQCINKLSSDTNKYNLKEDPLEGSTIYAGWTNDTCTLTFVFDGESAPYNTGYYWDSEKKERLTTVKYVVQKNVKLTREDYPSTSYIRNSDYRYEYSSSWYKDPARTQRVTVGTSYTPTEDTTFYKGYTDSNWVVTLKSADETGYFTQECKDYYEEDGIFDSMACQVNKPSGSATSQTWTLPETSSYIKNSDATKKIDGWYYDKDCTQPVNTDDNGNAVITGDTTIYIKWISAYKVITFDANGGYFYNYSTKTRTAGNLTQAIMTSEKKHTETYTTM